LEKNLGSIVDLTRLPAAMFVVDIQKEHIAVAEAKKLGIPVFAIVDTNSNPNEVDYVIPANDDATKSISLIVGTVSKAIKEGLEERKVEKDKEGGENEKKESQKESKAKSDKSPAKKTSARKTSAKKVTVEKAEEKQVEVNEEE